MNVPELRQRVHALCKKKGVEHEQLIQDITAYMLMYAQEFDVELEHTLSVMEDDSNLTDISIIDTNFRKPINDLISPVLKEDPIFPLLFDKIVNTTARSIGSGEYALAFILADYKFTHDNGDGTHPKGKTEVKKDNSSLKVIASNATKKGLVDDLNKKYFKGTKPGARIKRDFAKHIKTVTNARQQYYAYFSELYPGVDVTQLSEDVSQCYTDAKEFCNVIGKFALKRYKQVDGWYNIIYIKPDTKEVINVIDVHDIDQLGLKFYPKFVRGNCVQALADGYVDVKF